MVIRKFRRPAQLGPIQAEEIEGDVDPAEQAELAHVTAWALMGVPTDDFDQEHVDRLLAAVRTEGVDVVASFWDRAAAFTLAGALWRLYLLWQWNQMDPEGLHTRYDRGKAAMNHLAENSPDLNQVLSATGAVLAGVASEDQIAPVLESAAEVMRIMATDAAGGSAWVQAEDDGLAHPVTLRAEALLATAAELSESARQARRGTLG